MISPADKDGGVSSCDFLFSEEWFFCRKIDLWYIISRYMFYMLPIHILIIIPTICSQEIPGTSDSILRCTVELPLIFFYSLSVLHGKFLNRRSMLYCKSTTECIHKSCKLFPLFTIFLPWMVKTSLCMASLLLQHGLVDSKQTLKV